MNPLDGVLLAVTELAKTAQTPAVQALALDLHDALKRHADRVNIPQEKLDDIVSHLPTAPEPPEE